MPVEQTFRMHDQETAARERNGDDQGERWGRASEQARPVVFRMAAAISECMPVTRQV